jgi:hypothetical protein
VTTDRELTTRELWDEWIKRRPPKTDRELASESVRLHEQALATAPGPKHLISVVSCPRCGWSGQRIAPRDGKPIHCTRCNVPLKVTDQYLTIGRTRRFYLQDGDEFYPLYMSI